MRNPPPGGNRSSPYRRWKSADGITRTLDVCEGNVGSSHTRKAGHNQLLGLHVARISILENCQGLIIAAGSFDYLAAECPMD